jgi:hypothetical protein
MYARFPRRARAPSLAALLAFLAPVAWAQQQAPSTPSVNPPEVILESAAAGELSPDLFRVNRRPPIPFQRWEMANPWSGERIDPESILTLPDGRRVKARRYFAELNRVEKGLNALGYSLRDPEPEVKLQEVVVDPEWLPAEPVVRTETSRPLKDGSTAIYHGDWKWSGGNPQLFAGDVNGYVDLTGSVEMTRLRGAASGGATVFSNRWEVFSVTAGVEAPKTGVMTGTFKVAVLGATVYDPPLSTSINRTWWGKASRAVDVSVRVPFSVGPIPMTLRAGIQGSAGAQYYLGLNHAAAEGWFRPGLSTKAYIQVSTNLLIGGLGAGCDLVLLDAMVDIYGLAALESGDGVLNLHIKAYCMADLTALKGSVYVYAWIYVPEWRGWWFSWVKKRYSTDLWSSSGLTMEDYYFFSRDVRIRL